MTERQKIYAIDIEESPLDPSPSTVPSILKKKPVNDVADTETIKLSKSILASRLLIGVCIIVAAVVFSTVFYSSLSNTEQRNFLGMYHSSVNQIESTILTNINKKMSLSADLAHAYSGLNTTTNTWPNVTYEGFNDDATRICSRSNCTEILFSPILNASTRDGWEVYANTYDHTYNNGILHYQDHLIDTSTDSSTIYAPVWQVYPSVSPQLFMDIVTNNTHAITDMFTTASAVFTTTNTSFTHGSIFTPIEHPISGAIVGIVRMTFDWVSLFASDVQFNGPNVQLVLRISGAPSLVYDISGSVAVLSDVNFDLATSSSSLGKYQRELVFNKHISAIVTPSTQFIHTYITTRPLIYAASISCMLVVIGILFLIYDCLLFKQIRNLMSRASNAAAVVDDLFPAFFRDRLYAHRRRSLSVHGDKIQPLIHRSPSSEEGSPLEDDPTVRRPRRNTLDKIVTSMQMQSTRLTKSVKRIVPYISLDESPDENIADEEELNKPIAKHFPSATVLFADIAGFTNWSATRSPHDVFELLESLFFLFDRAAAKREVFKVETIGDCYMAVCGIPNEDTAHASTMADFALDMLDAMEELRAEKGQEFTEGLQIRIGIMDKSSICFV